MPNATPSGNVAGADLLSLETPVPIVDLDRLEANLERMASYTSSHGLALRPHVKTHKSPWIGARQVSLGAVGLTCATPHEAEEMSAVSGDILIAYPPVGRGRLARLMSLPTDLKLTVALDSAEAVRGLAAAAHAARRQVGVYVELDFGMRRVGVATAADAIDLARMVERESSLEFRGIAFYPGHIRSDVDAQDEAITRLRQDVGAAREAFERAGIAVPVISGGSTPTAWRAHETGATEVRPGTYVFNDRTTAMMGVCTWDDCALSVLATVVSTAVAGQAVIDAGSKALGREPLRAEGDGFGVLMAHPEVVVKGMSEEHGLLDLSRTDWRPEVGDVVRVIPNHVCIVVHCNDRLTGVRGDVVEREWAVTARGR
jgi:D-serine deaminase-like pyridoxal phosphate-dependent protein